jgi:hypothetical protein
MASPTFLSTVPGFRAAELAIDGLAICCFNSDESFWEVAYIRHQKHKLGITIMELNALDETVREKTYEVDDNILSFNISLTNGSEAHYRQYPRGGPAARDFKRTNTHNDPHDLGWMIDLAGWEPDHGKITKLKPIGRDRPQVTLARIHHSLLFTSKPDDNPVRLSPRSTDDPYGKGSFELGRTNDEVSGLLLATAPGQIRFESDPIESLRIGPLPYDEAHRYKIEIINMDNYSGQHKRGFTKGDFHYFYDVIEVDGDQKELWAVPKMTGRVAPDGDCNPGLVSLRTLKPLIES